MRFALVVAVVLPLGALAQTATPRPAAPEKVRQVVFDQGDDVLGERDAPDVEVTEVPQRPTFPTMVRVRSTFANKLLGSVHEL